MPHADFPYEEALRKTQEYLADDTMLEEIERIYSPLNKREFCGSPVHYKLNAASRETAVNLVKLLTKALYANKRVLSTRISYITDLDCDYRDELLEELCGNSYASVVAIECDDDNTDKDSFARDSERKCELICDSVREFAPQSVFILVDLGSKACKQSVQRLINKEGISFIEIFEGRGDAESGKKYLAYLLKENKVSYAEEDFVLPDQEEYSVSDIVKTYKDIKKNSIKNSIYRAYTLDEEAEKKCRIIFDCACKNAEFGNGRFVRNVLEQAIIKQSSRIVTECQNEIYDKKTISTLSASDFDINAAKRDAIWHRRKI